MLFHVLFILIWCSSFLNRGKKGIDISYVSMTLVNPDFLKRIFSPESVRVHFRV